MSTDLAKISELDNTALNALVQEALPLQRVRQGRLGRLTLRLLAAVVSLWTANGSLIQLQRETKRETADLYSWFAAVLAQQGGAARVSPSTLDAVNPNQRIRVFAIEGSEDVLLQLSGEPLAMSWAPRWFRAALQGEPIPIELLQGDPKLLPLVDVKDQVRQLERMG